MRIKAVLAANRQIFKNTCMFFIINSKNPSYVKLLTDSGKELKVTQKINNALSNFRYKWTIYMVVGCYNSKGEEELKIDTVVMKQEYYQKDLVDYLNEQHKEFIQQMLDKNVKISFVGWVAKLSGKELTPEQLFNLFKKYGGWE